MTGAVAWNLIHIGTKLLHVPLVMLVLEGSLPPCVPTTYPPGGCLHLQIGGLHLEPLVGLALSGIRVDANSAVVMRLGSSLSLTFHVTLKSQSLAVSLHCTGRHPIRLRSSLTAELTLAVTFRPLERLPCCGLFIVLVRPPVLLGR